MGSASVFLASSSVTDGFNDLAAIVRSGRPLARQPFADPGHAVWSEFAPSMAAVAYLVAQETAKLFDPESANQVLDVAAGHRLFGIAVARRNPSASAVALDWPSVLATAQGNARHAGVLYRCRLLPAMRSNSTSARASTRFWFRVCFTRGIGLPVSAC